MRIPLSIRITILIASVLSVFWLPWVFSIPFMFLAGFVFPPAAFALGIGADILYYPGSGFLWASAIGLFISGISALVRHFVKTRIM